MAKVTGDHDISTDSNSTHESMWSLTFALCVPKFMRIHDLGLPDKRLRTRQTATDYESSTDHHVFGCGQKLDKSIYQVVFLKYHPPRPPTAPRPRSSTSRTEHGLVLNWSSPICVEQCPQRGTSVFCPEGLEVTEEELREGGKAMDGSWGLRSG